MALDKKSVHVRLSPELHEKLQVMAEFKDKDIAEELARIASRGIVAEWYDFSIAAERMNRLGLTGSGRE